MKRKRVHEDLPQLAIDGPSSSGQLAIDYNYDHASTTVMMRIIELISLILNWAFSSKDVQLVMGISQHLQDDRVKHLFQSILIHFFRNLKLVDNDLFVFIEMDVSSSYQWIHHDLSDPYNRNGMMK